MSVRRAVYEEKPWHRAEVWRERTWPSQWIGQCSCGRGIRCNSRADAAEFLESEGCRLVPAPTSEEER